MLYAFMQSSNYSNLYNILQPEAMDLESYRRYIEQPHVMLTLSLSPLFILVTRIFL